MDARGQRCTAESTGRHKRPLMLLVEPHHRLGDWCEAAGFGEQVSEDCRLRVLGGGEGLPAVTGAGARDRWWSPCLRWRLLLAAGRDSGWPYRAFRRWPLPIR